MNNQNNNQDFIREYLLKDYDRDLRFIFASDCESECSGRLWLKTGHLDEIKQKNCECAQADPARHFVFSGIFLYQLMTHLLLWDEMSQRESESPDGKGDPRYLHYHKFASLLEHLGWPNFGLDIWKEFSDGFSQKKLFFAGLEEIIDRYGLMAARPENNAYKFILACIFDALSGMLKEGLQLLDIPEEEKNSIFATAKEQSEKILYHVVLGHEKGGNSGC